MNLVELAQRIRSLRLDHRLTLEEVASRAGLTRSWLSKVENFRVTPSLPALGKIAGALDVSVSELVEGLDDRPRLVVIRRTERKIVSRDSSSRNRSVYESLAHQRTNRVMDPFLITVPGGVSREQAMTHGGEEFLYVQTGSIQFEYDGDIVALRAGDSLYFDADVPHRLINPHKRTATVLCVFSDPATISSDS
jgi:transcriptional regulator with XRE-family HTH domain